MPATPSDEHVSYAHRRSASRDAVGWVVCCVVMLAVFVALDLKFKLVLFAPQPNPTVTNNPAQPSDQNAIGSDQPAAPNDPLDLQKHAEHKATRPADLLGPEPDGDLADRKVSEVDPPQLVTPDAHEESVDDSASEMPPLDLSDGDGFHRNTTQPTSPAPGEGSGNARVTVVLDGDTIQVALPDKTTVRLRLYGIDAPETDQPFGQTSKRLLKEALVGRYVHVRSFGKDNYGRTTAEVFVSGRSVNLELVKSGLAWHYAAFASDRTDLQNAERQARKGSLGLWSTSRQPTPPWEWRQLSDNKSN